MRRPPVPTAKYFYQSHKDSAKQRGIGFHFSEPEWIQWWVDNLGPDWMSKRGHRDGQFVMARKGDKGPYAPWNVKCITANENHSEMALNGTSTRGVRNPNAKLTEEQVLEIYHCKSSEMPAVAKVHNLSIRYIDSIKTKRIWGHVTAGLPAPETRGYAKGEGHGNAVLTIKQVREIYVAPGCLSDVAKRFGVNKGRVWAIKMGRSWRAATQDLGVVYKPPGSGKRMDIRLKRRGYPPI